MKAFCFLFSFVCFGGCLPAKPPPPSLGLERQLESEVLALKQRVRLLKEEVKTCEQGNQENTIYVELYQIFSGTEIEIKKEGRTTTAIIPTDYLFRDAYSLRFRSEAYMVFDLLSTALALHPEEFIMVEGHTDNQPLSSRGRRQYGDEVTLGFYYAHAFAKRLQEEFYIPASRFSVVSSGPHLPIQSNETENLRARNRRLEVHIFKSARSDHETP